MILGIFPGLIGVLRDIFEQIIFHVRYHFLKAFAEFVKVFLVEENLVLVK